MHLLSVEVCKVTCITISEIQKQGNSSDVAYFVVLLSEAIMQVQAFVDHLVIIMVEMLLNCKENLYVAYVEPIHKML